MPGRFASTIIVLFFMTMVGWQIARSIHYPYGQAPKLKDALEAAAEDGESHWELRHQGQRLGMAVTDVRKSNNSNIYTLRQRVVLDRGLDAFLGLDKILLLLNSVTGIRISNQLTLDFRTDAEVNYLGVLHHYKMMATVVETSNRPAPDVDPATTPTIEPLISCSFSARADGEGHLGIRGVVKMRGGFSGDLPDGIKVKYDAHKLLFSSLAPTDVLPNLLPGQRWEAPMVDLQGLLSSAMGSMGGKAMGPISLPERQPAVVRVLDRPEALRWNEADVSCWLVESGQKGLKVQVWVRRSDGRVLRQLAHWGERTLEILRLPNPPSS